MMQDKRKELRDIMNTQVFPILERWIEYAVKASDMATACILHAHIAYLFLHTSYEELNDQSVITMITAQIVLNSHYSFDSQTVAKVSRSSKNRNQKIGLGVADTEIFDLFQKQRGNIMKYLQKDAKRTNEIMETIVQTITFSNKSKSFTNNPAINTSITRYWRNVDGMFNIGRFVPDLSPRSPEEQEKAERDRPFTRYKPGIKSDIEVNIQLGTFTLNNEAMKPLDPEIYDFVDFREVFGEISHLR